MLKSYYGKPGFQTLVPSLHTAGMLGYAKKSFETAMEKHTRTNGVYLVPKKFQVMPVKGRIAAMHNVNTCSTHNVQAHANASMVTDGKDNAKEALREEIIRQAEAIGITVTEEIVHCVQTIANYDFKKLLVSCFHASWWIR